MKSKGTRRKKKQRHSSQVSVAPVQCNDVLHICKGVGLVGLGILNGRVGSSESVEN